MFVIGLVLLFYTLVACFVSYMEERRRAQTRYTTILLHIVASVLCVRHDGRCPYSFGDSHFERHCARPYSLQFLPGLRKCLLAFWFLAEVSFPNDARVVTSDLLFARVLFAAVGASWVFAT